MARRRWRHRAGAMPSEIRAQCAMRVPEQFPSRRVLRRSFGVAWPGPQLGGPFKVLAGPRQSGVQASRARSPGEHQRRERKIDIALPARGRQSSACNAGAAAGRQAGIFPSALGEGPMQPGALCLRQQLIMRGLLQERTRTGSHSRRCQANQGFALGARGASGARAAPADPLQSYATKRGMEPAGQPVRSANPTPRMCSYFAVVRPESNI